MVLKRKVQNLYTIVTRMCYRVRTSETSAHFTVLKLLFSGFGVSYVCVFVWQDLVFFTDDCEAIDTGHTKPYYAEDRLQLLQEERWVTERAAVVIGPLHSLKHVPYGKARTTRRPASDAP